MYVLENGEYYLTSEIDCEDKLRGVLSERLGRDAGFSAALECCCLLGGNIKSFYLCI